VDWIALGQDRVKWRTLVNTVMKLRVPHNSANLLTRFTTNGFSSSAQLHIVR
jgi:hypothetical protein